MFLHLVTPALALLLTTALALPTVGNTPVATLNESQLLSIAPKSSSCANAPFPSECRTAAQAVGPLSASFNTYGVTTPREQAAILSTIAFESGGFQYQMNHFPGTPGQGTRNMQSPAYSLKYAQSIPALAPYLEKIQTSDVVAVLDLLIKYTNYDFGSAAWFLTSQCSQVVRDGLQSGSIAGFSAYLGCIGAAETSDRDAYYQRAVTALGVKTSSQ